MARRSKCEKKLVRERSTLVYRPKFDSHDLAGKKIEVMSSPDADDMVRVCVVYEFFVCVDDLEES